MGRGISHLAQPGTHLSVCLRLAKDKGPEMNRRKTVRLAATYLAVFAGLFAGDWLWGGSGYALAKLPARAAIAAILVFVIWLLNRRKRSGA